MNFNPHPALFNYVCAPVFLWLVQQMMKFCLPSLICSSKPDGSRGTALGKRISNTVEDKILLDDDLVIETLNNIILSNKSSNLLIEGFPKTQNQAIIFEQLMGECSTLIELTAKPELLTKRILYKLGEQKGVTYTPEDINFRVNNYSTKMQSILSFYKGLGKLRRVDCAKSISEVYVEIRKAILSSVYFIIGVKGSGKTEVSKHYNSVTVSQTNQITFIVTSHLHRCEGE